MDRFTTSLIKNKECRTREAMLSSYSTTFAVVFLFPMTIYDQILGGDHSNIRCKRKCERLCPRGLHRSCDRPCSGCLHEAACPPCRVPLRHDVLPHCDHGPVELQWYGWDRLARSNMYRPLRLTQPREYSFTQSCMYFPR